MVCLCVSVEVLVAVVVGDDTSGFGDLVGFGDGAGCERDELLVVVIVVVVSGGWLCSVGSCGFGLVTGLAIVGLGGLAPWPSC